MPWDLDVADKSEFVFTRPAAQIVVTCSDPSVTDPPIVIELPALNLTREQVSPEWLAMHDAEQKERANGV